MALANELKVFVGRSAPLLAEKICQNIGEEGHTGIPLGRARTDVFPDGEVIVKLEEDVRGAIASSCSRPASRSMNT